MNATEYGTQVQNIDIIDDDIAQVLLALNTGAISESGGVAMFTVYTSGDVISLTGIDVTLVYTGTATDGSDYTTGYTLVTIVAGTTGTSFYLTGNDDVLVEGDETIDVSID